MRLAVTDRCNLRCHYCMPEEGITYVDRSDLLTYEEMLTLIKIGGDMGINKVRITGGEPFLRKNLIGFLEKISLLSTIDSWHITTNGTLQHEHIPRLKELGIGSINLSLDSMDRERFHVITRRDDFEKVLETIALLKQYDITTKINMVVMRDINVDDISDMIQLTREWDVSVRFLEEMPFNGSKNEQGKEVINHIEILHHIQEVHPNIERIDSLPSSTAIEYRVPGYVGSLGIIASYSRTFCGTCDRIRVTPTGVLKTCLYDQGVMNLRDIMRAGASESEVAGALRSALAHRAKDGKEAESQRSKFIGESMATIGG
ncbi:UNVERIFIED_CONTAM: hypothetical protein GTU68_015978 [Idotea baltica]|nr:hypothetical protein [Idotea baltica]